MMDVPMLPVAPDLHVPPLQQQFAGGPQVLAQPPPNGGAQRPPYSFKQFSASLGLSCFTAALEAADLLGNYVDSCETPLTIFAPSDEAFARLGPLPEDMQVRPPSRCKSQPRPAPTGRLADPRRRAACATPPAPARPCSGPALPHPCPTPPRPVTLFLNAFNQLEKVEPQKALPAVRPLLQFPTARVRLPFWGWLSLTPRPNPRFCTTCPTLPVPFTRPSLISQAPPAPIRLPSLHTDLPLPLS